MRSKFAADLQDAIFRSKFIPASAHQERKSVWCPQTRPMSLTEADGDFFFEEDPGRIRDNGVGAAAPPAVGFLARSYVQGGLTMHLKNSRPISTGAALRGATSRVG